MARLRQNPNGSYSARKRLPDDVREEYGRLYGARFEAKFFASAETKAHEAKQHFHDWHAEVEGRIATIRAERNGEGVSLTQRQAHALAGQWYDWFIAQHPQRTQDAWEALRDHIHETLRTVVGEARWEASIRAMGCRAQAVCTQHRELAIRVP